MNSQLDEQRVNRAELQNRYFVLRHGQSEANQQGLIASSPQVARSEFGLTNCGREQVVGSIDQRRHDLGDIQRIYTSDFRRARETAEIAGELLGAPVEEATSLRERGFGEWDRQSDENYQTVWAADAEDSSHQRWGVESVTAVASRMCQFVSDVDALHAGRTILIVSHGDPLQILITALRGQDLRSHRQLDALATAELRRLC